MKTYLERILPLKWLDSFFYDDINLSSFTTYSIGGKPLGVFILKNHIDYIKLLNKLNTKLPYRIIGKGSNLLINDERVEFFILTGKYRSIYFFEDEKVIRVFTTPFTELQYFIRKLISKGIGGYEELAAIPASVGGAVFNNAGVKNVEISMYLKKVTFFDRIRKTVRTIEVDQSFFSYRNSFFKEECFNKGFYIDFLSFVFEFPKSNLSNPDLLKAKYDEVWKKRMITQPLNEKSCGSVFKNLPNIAAWQVISMLGYKGFVLGGAKVSEKHANFIINFNNAKFNDVYNIINIIKQNSKKIGIELEEEVEIWKWIIKV